MSRPKVKSDPHQAPAPQRYLDAGIEAARTDNSRQQQMQQYDDGMSMYSTENSITRKPSHHYQQHHLPPQPGQLQHQPYQQQQFQHQPVSPASPPGHYNEGVVIPQRGNYEDPQDDFDDAASYHSTSSIPGISGTVGSKHTADGEYGQAASSRYQYLAQQSRGAAYAQRHDLDSYYSTDGNLPTGGISAFGRQEPGASPAMAQLPGSLSGRGKPKEEVKPKSPAELADEYFSKAVNFHEEGDFVSATAYFKKAADAHSPLGMMFYGLSLRHGWGCQPNEKIAFLYLQKAGELVIPSVKDMNPAVAGMAKEELAMAIYELGQSYRQGWGVSRNKKTAAYYFEIAAELGDADAQADLAACYESGDGVKRDKKKAAHYYRLAHKQGHEVFGNSWIFKSKYDSN
ncbi:hypothetical protein FBU59_001736 [Linderina macrospora]|uniref:Uncharacterized protein n=1 Tax=Linderina macrospora TaxID=4868 RepID=A0ACC1JD67_9FUNG|nr:hypothetical protein FBU59_001736 [Linderina macrospora]